jgi:hypothetical protein
MRARSLLALVTALMLGCTPALRRFPLAPPLWRDDDMRPVPGPVAPYESFEVWDFVEQSLFRPIHQVLAVQLPHESVNVNALDEVPDSSWFQNRLGRVPLSLEDIAQGPCTTPPLDPTQPWTITSAKSEGRNPGFVIRGPDGRKYLLKADGDRQPELPSASDVIGSRIYHALGYYAPCNRVVVFDRAILRLDPHARSGAGSRARHLTTASLERVLRFAKRLPDGRYRMSASQYVEGRPLGPFEFSGVRPDDPNDVVPHEDRRELRAARLVAAWLDHWDSREGNTMTSWIPVDAHRGYVRHYLLDFGDLFGVLAPVEAFSIRNGYVYPFDLGQISADLFTLGLIVRPWDRPRVHPEAWLFGYFRADLFHPEQWRAVTPNPAFDHMTERDGAWMARLIARFEEPELRAAVATGELSYPPWREHLVRLLLERRRRLLARYLTRLSPFADVTVEGERLCATDLARKTGITAAARYTARRYSGLHFERVEPLSMVSREGFRACALMPQHLAPDGTLPDSHPARYLVVDLVGAARGSAPLRVHLYDLGPRRGYRLAGLERPAHDTPPHD